MDSILEFADILGLLVRELTIRYHYVLLFVNKDWYNAVIQQHLTDGEVLLNDIPILHRKYFMAARMVNVLSSLALIKCAYTYSRYNGKLLWTDEEREWYDNLYPSK